MRVSRWLGGVTEWLMVADCKSAGLTPYVGSNPTPTMAVRRNGGRAVGDSVAMRVTLRCGQGRLYRHTVPRV
jgi:hypothetical protein